MTPPCPQVDPSEPWRRHSYNSHWGAIRWWRKEALRNGVLLFLAGHVLTDSSFPGWQSSPDYAGPHVGLSSKTRDLTLPRPVHGQLTFASRKERGKHTIPTCITMTGHGRQSLYFMGRTGPILQTRHLQTREAKYLTQSQAISYCIYRRVSLVCTRRAPLLMSPLCSGCDFNI